jgi:hypothetical protein
MAKKTEVTDSKTKKINQFTGGKIETFTIPDYPKSCGDGKLPDSFLAKDGTYIGDYSKGLWYLKHNMLVCFEYPSGVSIILKHPVKEYLYLDSYMTDGIVGGDDTEAYYGYSHRGGNKFKIGDRLFDPSYEPKEEDYTKEEWEGFKADREKSILRNIKDGFCKNREEAEKETPLAAVITFNKRGSKVIETWDEAKQAAINLSKDLS